jgi:O-antigen/teichoic acid export membrane protein
MNPLTPPASPSVAQSDAPRRGGARRLVRGSTLLLFGRVISKVANFATQILIVRYLSQTAYGEFAYALSIVTMVQAISTLGLDRSITRFVPIYLEQRDYKKLFGTITLSLLVIVGLGLLSAMVVICSRGHFGRWILDDKTPALLMVLVFLAPIQALDDLMVGLFAVFARARSIFLRRFLLAPGLILLTVLVVIAAHGDVVVLAIGYLASSALGLVISGTLFVRTLRQEGLLQHWSLRGLSVPWRPVLGFSLPLLVSDMVYTAMGTVTVVLLGHFGGAAGVAGLRAVQPTARLNELVMASFAVLFTPHAARLYAKQDRAGINSLYWRTAIWIAIFSFPIFVLTFSLAQPATVLFFGQRYAESGPILALLSLGYYFNAALGFNGLTLKVYGRVRYIVLVGLAVIALNVALSLILIPRFGPMGAGIAILGALIAHNVLKQAGLIGTGIALFDWRYVRIYVGIALSATGLLLFHAMASPPIAVTLVLAALVSLLLIRLNSGMLEVGEMFPEAMKLPGMRFLVPGRPRA